MVKELGTKDIASVNNFRDFFKHFIKNLVIANTTIRTSISKSVEMAAMIRFDVHFLWPEVIHPVILPAMLIPIKLPCLAFVHNLLI